MSGHFLVLFLALVIDRLFGDPDWLWRRFPHPVVFFGKAISVADRHLNDPALGFEERRRRGVLALILLLALAVAIGLLLDPLFRHLGVFGLLLEAVLASILLAHKSLADHVAAVSLGLRSGGLAGGRLAVSMIVGRDPETLDEPGVCRAAIESLAENFSDGVLAPAFWFAVAGLPGLFAYKMLNTADSMIGHKSDRYLAFGWAAARADDLANLIPARLSAAVVALAAWARLGWRAGRHAFGTALRDAGLHRSPNSGWPESAFAGALGIQLAGPRVYAGTVAMEPMINGAGRADLSPDDIEAALSLFAATGNVVIAIAAFLMLVVAFV